VMETLLDEDVENAVQAEWRRASSLDLHRGGGSADNLGAVSAGLVQFVPEVPLAERAGICVGVSSGADARTVVVGYGPSQGRFASLVANQKSVLAVFRVPDWSRPQRLLALHGQPTSVCVPSGAAPHVVVAGTRDGGLSVWDLRQRGVGSSGGGGPPSEGGAASAAGAEGQRPSYATDALGPAAELHVGAVVGVASLGGGGSGGGACKLVSVDETGRMILWAIEDQDEDAAPNSFLADFGMSPGGRVRLVRVGVQQVTTGTRKRGKKDGGGADAAAPAAAVVVTAFTANAVGREFALGTADGRVQVGSLSDALLAAAESEPSAGFGGARSFAVGAAWEEVTGLDFCSALADGVWVVGTASVEPVGVGASGCGTGTVAVVDARRTGGGGNPESEAVRMGGHSGGGGVVGRWDVSTGGGAARVQWSRRRAGMFAALTRTCEVWVWDMLASTAGATARVALAASPTAVVVDFALGRAAPPSVATGVLGGGGGWGGGDHLVAVFADGRVEQHRLVEELAEPAVDEAEAFVEWLDSRQRRRQRLGDGDGDGGGDGGGGEKPPESVNKSGDGGKEGIRGVRPRS
ncbi:hypothetical protein HK405_008469, partial [Cladochytrium tenue]